MKLGLKLPLAFATSLLLVACAAMFGIQRLNSAVDTYGTTVQASVTHERAVGAMLVAFKVQVQEWKDTLLRGKDPVKLQKHWAAFEKQEHAVDDLARDLLAALPAGESRTLIEQFARAHSTMGGGYRKGLEAFTAAKFEASAGDNAVAGVDREPAKLLGEAAAKIEADSAAVSGQAAAEARSATLISIELMAVVCVASIAGGFLFSRTITRPLASAVAAARAMASGDLSAPIDARGHDETADLMQALKDMQANLASVVAGVRLNSENVASASAQIASGNNNLSERTEQQAAALEQTAASMEELSSTVRQNADNAKQASRLAISASSVAEEGGTTVGRVVETMKGINNSSRKVVEIISVIDGIAFQTNILALNAAVEAARAGEQGRGFAVVASEVRSLAQRSAEAAKQIKALISASVERVAEGTSLVDRAGVTMIELVASVRKVTDIIGEISAATSEQSTGVSQVSQAVAQMDKATQQNSALVEESAAAAASLRSQAEQLVQAVVVFKLTPSLA
jgi:methyl-accepting chemotaxis protein